MKYLSWLKGSGYIFLWGIPGILTLVQGLKLNKEFPKDAWLARPGSYLIIIAGALLCFACIEVYQRYNSKKSPEAKPAEPQEKTSDKKIMISLLYLFGYILLIPVLGFALTSIIFLALVMLMLKNSVKSIVITAVIISLFVYVILPRLGISLPYGIWNF